MPNPVTPLLVDIPTAAGLLSLGLRTVESMVAKGEIGSRKIRTRRLIPMTEINRLAALDRTAPPATASAVVGQVVGMDIETDSKTERNQRSIA